MEADAARDDQRVPEISGRAVGVGVGAIQRGESLLCELRRHDCEERPGEFDGDAERSRASVGRNAVAAESVLDGSAAGGFAKAGRVAEGNGEDAGHAEGFARGADRGGVLPRTGAVCTRRGGRHHGRTGGGKHSGAEAAAWTAKPDGGSVCDELQDADLAEIFKRGGRSDDQGVRRKEAGGFVRSGQRRRACATRDGGGRRDAAELFDRAAADPGLPCFERTRSGFTGDGGVPDDRDPDLQEFGAGDGGGVEEKVDGDGWRAGQAVWIPRGYARSGECAAAAVSRVCIGRA